MELQVSIGGDSVEFDVERRRRRVGRNFCRARYARATGGYLLDKSWPASLHAARYPIDRSLYTFRECRPRSRVWLRSPILRPAPDTRSLSFNAFPSPFPREVLLSRNWRIEENREYRGLFRGDAFGRGVIRFICITTTVRAQSRSRAHGRSSNGHVQRTYSSNGACMHLIPVE